MYRVKVWNMWQSSGSRNITYSSWCCRRLGDDSRRDIAVCVSCRHTVKVLLSHFRTSLWRLCTRLDYTNNVSRAFFYHFQRSFPLLPSHLSLIVCHSSWRIHEWFLPHDAMHCADYGVTSCPSVRQSHASILPKWPNVSSNFVYHCVATPF